MRATPLTILAWFFVAASAAAAGPAPALAQATAHVKGAGADRPAVWREVAAMLEHGAVAWNAGDLMGFVSDYTPDATFVTARGLVRGTADIRSRYAARFAPGAARDSLTFVLLDVEELGPRSAAMVATYVLSRGDSVTATGPTSLVLRKVAGRWRIAHDHSS